MTEEGEAWSPLDEDNIQLISTVRLDLAMLLDMDLAPPPVLFETCDRLIDWAADHGLNKPEKIDGSRTTSAIRLRGQYRPTSRTSRFEYDQVWVKSTYTLYSKPMQEFALKGFDVDRAALDGIHADHVINQARLLSVPDSWVMIFPVHGTSNSPFGAIEGRLAPIEPGFECLRLPPLVALKLYCGRLPKTNAELDHAMRDVRGQFHPTDGYVRSYCDQIESETRPYMRG